MKLTKAIVRPNKVDDIKDALAKCHISGMTVMEVCGHGRQKGHAAVYRGREYEVGLLPKMAVDIVVPDGRVFVIPVEQSLIIRTGEKDVV